MKSLLPLLILTLLSLSSAVSAVGDGSNVTDTVALSLSKGWNLVGISTEPDEHALETLTDNHPQITAIWNYCGDCTATGWQRWIRDFTQLTQPQADDLTSLQIYKGYWFHLDDAVTTAITGNSVTGPFQLTQSGWSMIAVDTPVTDMQSLMEPHNLDSIWSWENGQWKSYLTDIPYFLNSLSALERGKGYYGFASSLPDYPDASDSGNDASDSNVQADSSGSLTIQQDVPVPMNLDGESITVILPVTAPDGTTLQFSLMNTPASGSVISIDATSGSLVYQPNSDATGNESLQYRVVDNEGLSVEGEVEIPLSLDISGTGSGMLPDASGSIILTSDAILTSQSIQPGGGYSFTDLPVAEYVLQAVISGHDSGNARVVTPTAVAQPLNATLQPNVRTLFPRAVPTTTTDFTAIPLPVDRFRYHWEEDVSVSGSEYSAYINQPHQITVLEQQIELPDLTAATRLQRHYNVLLSDADQQWSREHAYRLLETMKSIPQQTRSSYAVQTLVPSIWHLTNDHLPNDITITDSTDSQGNLIQRNVVVSSDIFTYASPKLVQVDGKRGVYYSKRLHHALVRFVTSEGTNNSAADKILRERFGLSIQVDDYSRVTGEDGANFQSFHPWELVEIINLFEEMPSGFHKITGLDFLIRRQDGHPHPLYPDAPAVAWPTRSEGYIEFMDIAFTSTSIDYLHRLIVHEKSHFIWEKRNFSITPCSYAFSRQTFPLSKSGR
ncbi:MAG: Ig-like domain-containing protein [Gammaproteobacteria bacterium]|nr:Ig-like domain-containing protein [Gammaproteobacteria bacterium]